MTEFSEEGIMKLMQEGLAKEISSHRQYLAEQGQSPEDIEKSVSTRFAGAEKALDAQRPQFKAAAQLLNEQGAKLFENYGNLAEQMKKKMTENGDKIPLFEDRLTGVPTGVAHAAFLKKMDEMKKDPATAAKAEELTKGFYSAANNTGGGFAQAAYAMSKLQELDNGGNTRTAAVQRGTVITLYNPESKKDGVFQDMKHYALRDGKLAEISLNEANSIVNSTSPRPMTAKLDLKYHNDDKGHIELTAANGQKLHANVNSGKIYSKDDLQQMNARTIARNNILSAGKGRA